MWKENLTFLIIMLVVNAHDYLSYQIDPNTLVFGVSTRAFDRVGLEGYIPSVAIAALRNDTSIPFLQKIGIATHIFGTEKMGKISKLMQTKSFSDLVSNYQKEKKVSLLITNISPEVEKAAANLRTSILGNSFTLRQRFENKVNVRGIIELNSLFPPFLIAQKSELGQLPFTYKSLQQQFGSFVLQDESEHISGGRGTTIVHDERAYRLGIQKVAKNKSQQVVISKYVHGQSVSIQACITKDGIFHGPLQQQIVTEPHLTRPGSSQFAGAQWSVDPLLTNNLPAASRIVQTVGRAMQSHGYKGIFGLDLIIEESGSIKLVEINARLTALTPPLTLFQNSRNIPSLLFFHVLEHLNASYKINDAIELQKALSLSIPFSYLVLHNVSSYSVSIKEKYVSGWYEHTDGKLSFRADGVSLRNIEKENYVLLPDIPVPDRAIVPGAQLVRLFCKGVVLTKEGNLRPESIRLIKQIQALFSPV
ncbi:MAG: ATP-grasp domain-containing protein [Candidatus Andersenbacteria bacterium]|nr:ATP-grasp domain-containing protein [Candidatus Andersenbacteria bacterium]MBI3250284.1 ATP-grasp domain-containing protein [Candidatus Andersenbacteria bacterium]